MTKSKKILITSLITLALLCIGGAITFAIAIMLRPEETPPAEIETEVAPTIPGDSKPYNFDYSWMDEGPYIAHAMGSILGDVYTNSYEAFLLNYQLGQRLFEIDFVYTSDDEIVAAHYADPWHTSTGAANNVDFSYANVRTYPLEGKYHALDYRHTIDLLIEHPDIYLITDTKYSDQATVERQFTEMVTYAQSVDETVLDRLVIQIYNQEMLDWVMAIYPWKSVIYTLYGDPTWTPENVLAFSQESGIKIITMWGDWVTDEVLDLWLPNGINVGAHTIDNYDEAMNLLDRGVSLIYTNFLIP